MALDPVQIGLIRESFEWLTDNPERRSMEFYNAFFNRAPELKAMFRGDLEGQGMRFLSMLSAIVASLGPPRQHVRPVDRSGAISPRHGRQGGRLQTHG